MRQHWFGYLNCGVEVWEFDPERRSLPELTFIFIHGRFGGVEMWSPVLANFSPEYHCVCLGLPGLSRSFSSLEKGLSLMETAQLLHRVVDRFAGDRAVLIGQDIGGALAQLYALLSPHKVAAVILLNSSSLSEKLVFQQGLFSWRFRREWLNAMKELRRSWPGFHQRRYWRSGLSRLDCPVLLLWGGKDSINPVENALSLHGTLENAKLFVSEKSGHWPNLEDPEWTVLKIRQFVSQLS